MKKFLPTFILLLSLFTLSAENKEKEDNNYYQLNTKYFQIIYKKESIATASLLYENADRIYEEIAKKLETETNLSMPILIRSDIQVLNAYFTSFPYNRIVLYDTVSDNTSLAVFSETILSVFYHELTHAVSLNIKNKLWQGLSTIFGDPYSLNVFTTPTSFSEGATVSLESAKGEGRLNSGYSLNVLVQAKLENNFPDWKEASGANDEYRIGDLPYIAGGAFHKFLQEKYGIKKYAELWKALGSNYFFTEQAFKKVYGRKLKDEWKDFEDSIPILPVIEGNQIALTENDKISCFTASKNMVAYFSGKENEIYIIKDGKTKKLLLERSVTDLAISETEDFLAITKLSEKYTYYTYVYDLQENKYLTGKLEGFRNPCFTYHNDSLVLAGITSEQNKSSLEYYKIDSSTTLKNNFSSKKEEESLWVDFSKIEIYDITSGITKNTLGILGKIENSWFVGEVSLDNFIKKNYEKNPIYFEIAYNLPMDIFPLSLKKTLDNEYLISYTEKKYSLSRIGILTDDEITFQKEDISGGIQNPYKTEEGYIFLSRMLKNNTVSFIKDIPGGLTEPKKLSSFTEKLNTDFQNLINIDIEEDKEKFLKIAETSKKYSDIKFAHNFFVIPFVSNYYLGKSSLLYELSENPGLGASFLWENPTETTMVGVGLGYSENKINANFSLGKAINTYTIEGTFTKYADGYYFSQGKFLMNTEFYIPLIRENNRIQFSNTFLFSISDTNYAVNLDIAKIIYSGINNKFGFTYYYTHQFDEKDTTYQTPGLFAEINIPHLLPFKCFSNVKYNLPCKIVTTLCSTPMDFVTTIGNLNLLTSEIHKSVPLIPFYVNRFAIDTGYFVNYQNKQPINFSLDDFGNKIMNLETETYFLQGITSSMYFELTPVIGNLVNAKSRLGIDFTYYLDHPNLAEIKPYEITIAGLFTF